MRNLFCKKILEKGEIGEVYNVGSGAEKKNIDVVRIILKELGKARDYMEFVTDCPGHDFRYSLDFSKINKLGLETKISFNQ